MDPKLRVVKFKPKRGYKRRTGHRQDLTRIEVTAVKLAAKSSRQTAVSSEQTPKPVAAEPAAAAPPEPETSTPETTDGA